MKLSRIAHLFDDPGPFASAYVEVSREQEDGDFVAGLEARGARDGLVAQGCPEGLAQTVHDALAASTHEAAPISRFVVASERGVLLDELVARHRPQPLHTFAPLPDLGAWIEDQSFEVPFVLALVDHEGGDVLTYGTGSARPEHTESHTNESNFEQKVRGGGSSHLRYQRSAEAVWGRNAQEVAEAVDRQVRTGPTLVVLAGDVHSRRQVEEALGHVQATVVQLEAGGRSADGGDEALDAAVREVLREQAVTANLDQLHTLKRRLDQGNAAVAGVHQVVEAFVLGQVDRLFVNTAQAAEQTVTLADHPGLALGAPAPDGPVRADLVLVAAAAVTDAEVVVERTLTLGDAPAAALLRWDNTAQGSAD